MKGKMTKRLGKKKYKNIYLSLDTEEDYDKMGRD